MYVSFWVCDQRNYQVVPKTVITYRNICLVPFRLHMQVIVVLLDAWIVLCLGSNFQDADT